MAEQVETRSGGVICCAAKPHCPRPLLCYGEICVAPRVCHSYPDKPTKGQLRGWNWRLARLEKKWDNS